MSQAKRKQPQDRQKKAAAVEKLQAEADDSTMGSLLGKEVEVVGRVGTVTVTILDDPMQWDADVMQILDGWAAVGGAKTAEVIPLLSKIISLEDGERLKRVRPNLESAIAVAQVFFADGDEEDVPPVAEVGESRAS